MYAVITGASTGIGKAIAMELSKKATVIITYNKSEKEADAVCKLIASKGGKAFKIKADLRNETERVKLKNEIVKITKQVDVLVNNAGIFLDDGPDVSDKDLQDYFALHAIATARMCSLLKPFLTKNASIINIASIHGMLARPHALGYCASKAAVHAITQALAQEYAPIRVNTLSPGPVDTPMWAEDDKKTIADVAKRTLLKRFAKPEEIAKVVSFLAFDAMYITGSNIVADGGALLYRE
ncbi:SDR family oxidoreductase [Candidatus Woesearchaeota archaeon]|nr:MAG: SDR family oxidoreductase [Candidatus Woesearchaeota archaeon]